MIRKQTVYTQTLGEGEDMDVRMITADEAIDGSGDSIYAGHAIIGIQTPHGPIEQPIRFHIEGAANIEEAFEKFISARDVEAPKEAKKVIEHMKAQMEQQRSKIIVPEPGRP